MRRTFFFTDVLVIVSADKAVALTLDSSSPIEIMFSAAVGAVDESAVFIDFTHTGLTNSALAHLADNIPCFLVNNCFMSVLETKLFFLRNLDGSLVLERSYPCTAVDGVSEIDFVIKNISNRA